MRRAPILAAALAAAALAVPAGAQAALIDVEITGDEYSAPSDDCSLREAVRAANDDAGFGGCVAGDSGTADAIRLAPGATYALTRLGNAEDAGLTGDLDLDTTNGISIERLGSGARPTIDANDLDGNTGDRDRAIDLHESGAFGLDGVRIVDGDAEFEPGGAIRWAEPGQPGALTISDSELAGNFTADFASAVDAQTTGEHLVEDTSISGGLSSDKGALLSMGELTVLRSQFTGNSGGVIFAGNAGPDSLRVERTTIADNLTGIGESIGAIYSAGGAQVVNATISGNSGGFVGGIEAHGDLEVAFSTIVGNYGIGGGGDRNSGGIDVHSADSVTLDAVILADNLWVATPMNCNDPVEVDERPSLDSGSTCGLETTGPAPSLVNTAPQLAPLADNGGPTLTRGLYPDSPALDAVDGCDLGATDQRGVSRPSDGCDIGAFEGTVPRPPDPPDTTPTPPAKPKKCKKGRKLKRGKCVKPKRKKRAVADAAAVRTVIGRSVKGREIRATRFGDPEAERVALVVGVIHGDERAGLEITRRLRRMGPDLEETQLWVIDNLNPDGSRARMRRNARGVDLNRNFPYRWRGGVPAGSGYYPGRRPASEPETRAAMKLIRKIQPDVSIWYHQPWGAVLACNGNPAIAARYAKLSGMGTSCRGKGLRGTAISWENAKIPGSRAWVVELPARGVTGGEAQRHARAAATVAQEG